MDQSTIESNSPRARAVRTLREWIQRGVLKRGETLPSEHALSQQLKVGKATVGRALHVLEEEGLLHLVSARTRVVGEPTMGNQRLVQKAVVVLWPSVNIDTRPVMGGWSEAIVKGMLNSIRDAGLHSLALNPETMTAANVEQLVRERPYAVTVPDILHGPFSKEDAAGFFLRRLAEARIPVVCYGDSASFQHCDRVTSDHEAGSYALTRLLIERGRKRICMFWDTPFSFYWSYGRRHGYERAMKEAGLEPLPVITVPPGDPQVDGEEERFKAFVRRFAGYLVEILLGNDPPDALMMASDGLVGAAAGALRLFKKRPNQDILLVGYDNYWHETPWRPFESCGPLATVDKRNYESGQEMIRLLLERLEGKLPPEPQCRVVQPELIIPDVK